MKETVLVLGSGPIRIGQGIEFDYSCVHCVWALESLGYRPIIMNNNPETVSTDFDTGEGLYFEPVVLEDVLDVERRENPIGVVCQFGGQTAINLAEGLDVNGIKVLGTSPQSIALAEDREQFDRVLEKLNIARPKGRAVRSLDEAKSAVSELGYPVLIRPSFVLGGRAMVVVTGDDQLEGFYREAEEANPGQPVFVDQYIDGTEVEVDLISDGTDAFVPGIMEHIERAGVHSGDSMAVYPPVTVSPEVQREIVLTGITLARELQVKGLLNIQFVVKAGKVYVLEANPRASRTVPYLSKVTGIPMASLAAQCMMGISLASLNFGSGIWVLGSEEMHPQAKAAGFLFPESDLRSSKFPESNPPLYAVKAPVFSFLKLALVEPSLGPEMKSTGEVLGIDTTYEAALYKALAASGIMFKPSGFVVLTVRDEDKPNALETARKLVEGGYLVAATGGTHEFLTQNGIKCQRVSKIQEGEPNLLKHILNGEVSLMVNTPSLSGIESDEAKRIRRACIEAGIACITNIDTALALVKALDYFENPEKTSCLPYTAYLPKPAKAEVML